MTQVLVVDDNRELANDLVEILEQAGHRAVATYGGDEALEHAVTLIFEAALVDIRLPRADGVQVVRKLQRLRPDARYLFMTGWSEQRLIEEATTLSHHPVFLKPLDLPQLLSLVASVR